MKPTLMCTTLLSLLVLSACGQNEQASSAGLSCEAPEVMALLKEQIQSESVRQAAEPRDSLPGGYAATDIGLALTALGFELDGVRTVKPLSADNTTLGCEATLRLNPSTEAAKHLQESFSLYMLIHETDGVDMAGIMAGSNNWLKADGNHGYTRPLPYTAQLDTGNNKAVVSLDSKMAAAAIALPLRFYLAHGKLNADGQALQQKAASDTAREQELDALNQAQLQARIEAARTANQGIHQQLNQFWQNLAPGAQSALQEQQQQWNRLREAECAYYGKSESVEPMEQEALRLECDTQRVQQRLGELSQQAEGRLQTDLSDARRRNQEADREIRRLWQSIPDDVKAIIGADYQNWNQATAAKCTAAGQQAGSGQAAQLARLECETTETQNKIKELNGYVSQ